MPQIELKFLLLNQVKIIEDIHKQGSTAKFIQSNIIPAATPNPTEPN